MAEKGTSEAQRIFEQAHALAKNEIPLHEKGEMPVPGWWLRRKLKRAIGQFEQVLQTHPDNWASMWYIGMIYRRFKENHKALSWFERAYQVNPSQPDVAREACATALKIGRSDQAIAYAYRATQINPEDFGLKANLALAYLLGNQLPPAREAISQALAGDPGDKISQNVAKIIDHFLANGEVPPTTPDALAVYWRHQPKS